MTNFTNLLLGFVLGVLSSYVYDQLRLKFRRSKRDNLQKVLNDADSWTTSDGENYFYEKEPEYNIKVGEASDNLSDRFKKFPDREHDRISWVEVRYNETTLFGWNFMHLDGYRLFLPVPQTEYDPENQTYDYYNLSRLEFKIFEIIGQANLMGEKTKLDGIKTVANILKIMITNSLS